MKNLSLKTAIAVALVCAVGCVKVAYDCKYTIVPYVQTVSGGAGVTPDGTWTAFLYKGTTEDYYISSYDTVSNGELWSRKDSVYVQCSQQTAQNEQGNLVLQIKHPHSIVIVCAPDYKVFAWREVETTQNLWTLNIPLWVRVWRESDYSESRGWKVVFPPSDESGE